MTLQATIELGVFDIISKAGPDAKLSASEIAARMPTHNKDAPQMLDRMLWLLATHSVVDCSVVDLDRLYSLNSVSGFFATDQDGVSLGPLMALLQDKVFLDSWSQLKDAVLEGGIPFDRVHGTHAFEYPGLDSRFNQVFNKAMYNHSTIVIKNIVEVYRGFENVKQLVDVGGGLGVTLKAVTAKFPHIKGINFDLPHVIQHAPHYPSVEHVGGDMFESVPKGDAIFMKWILHDWSDEHCLRHIKENQRSITNHNHHTIVVAPSHCRHTQSTKASSPPQHPLHVRRTHQIEVSNQQSR
ncbi:hypothetical protein LWI29_027593 [Acer saccharum]|uniref:Uncharacterized protein n=1 Tax=Acer saccharum TaxID=4024 RepID=A0AA39RXU1_ACESA|nr:hypothetical protein LWI29_027593 [Acer saccharum]